MAENKKIKNATKRQYEGINFRSSLEVMTYKTLKSRGITPEYESKTFLLWEGFVPQVPFYTKNNFKRKNHNIVPLGFATVMDKRPLAGITYTPDFYFEYNGKKIIVECKGMENDVFPYKFKMFRKHLEELPDSHTYEVWEIFTKKQLDECINHLMNSRSI